MKIDVAVNLYLQTRPRNPPEIKIINFSHEEKAKVKEKQKKRKGKQKVR